MPVQERFDSIYTATYDKLYHFISRNIADKNSVKDVMQECYIRLWENLHQLTDDETIIVLLRKYAIHLIINSHHKYQKERLRNTTFYEGQPLTVNPEDSLYANELLQKYKDVLDTFPAKRKTVFLLKREKGLSHKEIAEELGISVFTIDRHMNEALRTLREQLSSEKLALILVLLSIQTIV